MEGLEFNVYIGRQGIDLEETQGSFTSYFIEEKEVKRK